MKLNNQKNWTLFAIFGMAYWFFGNLYEAIVFGPNWMIDDARQLDHLNAFFQHSTPTVYFVPMTLLAAIAIWLVTYFNKIESLKGFYRKASILVLVITIMTSLIVAFVLSQMFGEGYYANMEAGSFYGKVWNILNAIRLVLEGFTIYYLFNAYRQLDKMDA